MAVVPFHVDNIIIHGKQIQTNCTTLYITLLLVSYLVSLFTHTYSFQFQRCECQHKVTYTDTTRQGLSKTSYINLDEVCDIVFLVEVVEGEDLFPVLHLHLDFVACSMT